MSNQDQMDDGFRFQGFRSPNYTMVPDELFDQLLPVLSGSELKVLLYIIRRTFGFKRESDTISLSQMLNGIITRDGRVLDRGAGVSKPPLLQALRSLQEKSIIFAERQVSNERGNEPTIYRLNLQQTPLGKESYLPLVKKVDQGVGKEPLPSPRSRTLTTQDTGSQETVKQKTDFEVSKLRKAAPEEENSEPPGNHTPENTTLTTEPVKAGSTETYSRARPQQKMEGEDFATPGSVLAAQGHLPQRGDGSRSSRSTAPSVDTDARQSSTPHQGGGTPRPEVGTEEWQRIQFHIDQFRRELGDKASLRASTSRAYNLFLRSGLSITTFVERLFRARAITQEYTASITSMGTDPSFKLQRKTKTAYFFGVLEDLLGLLTLEERTRRDSLHAQATQQLEEKKAAERSTSPAKKPVGKKDDSNGSTPRPRDSDGPYGRFIDH